MGLQIHSPLLQYHQNKFSGVDHQGCGLFCSYPLVKQHQVILSSTNGESPLAINPSMAKKKGQEALPPHQPSFRKAWMLWASNIILWNQSINRTDASKRFSNSVIGCLNLLTLLASVPIIGGGLWMSKSSATCESSLQTPLLVLGFVVLLVSLAGFVGACFNVAWALWLYLLVMLLLIGTLLGLTAFGFAVTAGGGGVQVPGRPYHEYRLDDYTGWLRRRITERQYWKAAMACVVGSKTCAKIALWTPLDYLQRDLSPIQSGCCKPPTSCTYGAGGVVMAQDEDCYRWNNAANVLCYACDSCKAGVLEQVRRDWHKLSVLNVVVLIFLIAIYTIGCCAFRNARRAESEYPYEENRMSKIRPRWDYFWWRWLRDRREQLY